MGLEWLHFDSILIGGGKAECVFSGDFQALLQKWESSHEATGL